MLAPYADDSQIFISSFSFKFVFQALSACPIARSVHVPRGFADSRSDWLSQRTVGERKWPETDLIEPDRHKLADT